MQSDADFWHVCILYILHHYIQGNPLLGDLKVITNEWFTSLFKEFKS